MHNQTLLVFDNVIAHLLLLLRMTIQLSPIFILVTYRHCCDEDISPLRIKSVRPSVYTLIYVPFLGKVWFLPASVLVSCVDLLWPRGGKIAVTSKW